MPSLDVFNQDAFGVISLTDAINNLPFVPGLAGQVIDWNERGVTTTSIMIEEQDGVLKLLNPTPRGGAGETKAKDKRRARSLLIPHYQHDDGINADEVQGVRAFGSETDVQSVMPMVNSRLSDAVSLVLDPTLEYQRLGAVKGLILNADGSTLYDLFTEFGVSQESEIDFDLDNASPASGALRKKCASAVRLIADNLGGVSYTGVASFCGDAFFDDLLAHKEVVESYKNTPMASVLREGYILPTGNKMAGMFEFGGILWMNYRGKNGSSAMVDTDKCHIFPVGTPGLFRTVYAPADYMETVNTIGLPRYAKQWLSPNGKRIEMESQSNPLSYCTRPKVLLKGKRT
ncbi:MAG: major capsid protein E [Lysobacterales bacterium 69-70]|nr:major capsid protein [Xanthomonadaceae bacterium]ODU35326.1 MAG: major capsid protein E [Xanthomonadaceae bacterium SCN 69-320]ODV17210.1 MAG: major capsid protein E [Xanthomonadaceae bacterium SCN 69-25]OJY94222.1 MAG: major capsid protein E [Xanthomonadales bacterium 69-70]